MNHDPHFLCASSTNIMRSARSGLVLVGVILLTLRLGSAVAGPFMDDFGGAGEDAPEVGVLAPGWHSDPGHGTWEVNKGILRGSFSRDHGQRQLVPALLLAAETDIPDSQEAVYEVIADVAVRSERTVHSAGLAAQVPSSGGDYYVLRFNLPGVVQLIRTGGAESILLDEKQVGRLISGQPYRLTLRSLGAGKLEWKMESPLRTLGEGFAEDPEPLPQGGLAGLWTNAAAHDGEPTAHFRLFAFHRESSGLETELPFLDEVDPRDFPALDFPQLETP